MIQFQICSSDMEHSVNRRDFLRKSSQAAGIAMFPSLAEATPGLPPPELIELTATQAVAAMKKGDIKAEDYAQALLGRAANLPQLNAFRVLDPASVLEAARKADLKRASNAQLGALHGLPIPIKDSVNTHGIPTSNGSLALRDFKPERDASIVSALLNEGAFIMGKTNLHELSFGWTSNNESFGAVRNPYNLECTPGGSSGGSAVAVSSRIAPLAVAEDTWASIRLPAAFCGLAGLRPTFGRYPGDGIMPLTASRFDQVGPLARSVSDLLLFDAVATRDMRPQSEQSLQNLRIGVSREFFWEGLHPEVHRLVERALAKFREAGAKIVEIKIPEIVKEAPDIAATIIAYEAKESISNFLREQGAGITFEQLLSKVGSNVKSLLETMALPPNRPSNEVHSRAVEKLRYFRSELRKFFADHNIAVLAFPATMVPPPLLGNETEVDIDGRKVPLASALARNMSVGSCGGLPSLILPVGLTAASLPVGIELASLPGRDRDLLAVGSSFEKVLGPVRPPNI